MDARRAPATYGIRNPLVQTAVVSLAYLAAGWLGLRVPVLEGHISLVWLPSGIALAGVLLWGYRVLPGVALGAALVPSLFGAPPGAIAGHVLGATAAAALGGLALYEMNLREGFRRSRDVVYFVIVAVLSPLVSATSAVLGIAAAGVAPWSAAFDLLRDAWIGHTMGIVIATPLFVSWAEETARERRPGTLQEGFGLFIGLGLVTAATWSGRGPPSLETLLLYAMVPFFMWAAMRFSFRIVASATTIGWIGAVAGTLLGYGPFSGRSDPLIAAYAYLGVMSLTTYVIAGLVRERSDTQRSLGQSQQKFRDLVHSAPDMILQVDRKGMIVFSNRDQFGNTGIPIRGCLPEIVQPAYAQPLDEKIQLVFWNATPSIIEIQLGKGRNMRWYSLQLGPLRKGERVEAVMVIGQDITERKEAEAKLRENETRLRAYFDGSPLPIAILDLSGRFLQANPAVAELLDATAEELSEIDIETITVPRDKNEIRTLFTQLANGDQERFVAEVGILRREGEQVWARLQVSLIRDPAGDSLFAVCMMEDISAQKRAVEAEHLAATRGMKIGELEEVSEWKTQLLNIASHELRNPLTPMKLQVDLLKRGIYGELNEKQAHAVDKLGRQSDRLSNLVSGILDVARIQTGRLQIDKKYTDLRGMVYEVCEEFEDAAVEWGIALEKRIEGDPEAVVDGDRLKQVVFNLLSNAFKFTTKGNRVTVRVASEGDDQVIRIEDDGHGLEEAQIDRLFEAFSQVHDTKGGDKKGGLGLGLFISKGIVEAHGGTIWCESPGLGQGTTFGFRIPAGDVKAAKRAARGSAVRSKGGAGAGDAADQAAQEGEVSTRVDALIRGLMEPGEAEESAPLEPANR